MGLEKRRQLAGIDPLKHKTRRLDTLTVLMRTVGTWRMGGQLSPPRGFGGSPPPHGVMSKDLESGKSVSVNSCRT